MVGDRLNIDMAFAMDCGFVGLLPLTGVTTEQTLCEGEEELARMHRHLATDSPPKHMAMPHYVLDSVAALLDPLTAGLASARSNE